MAIFFDAPVEPDALTTFVRDVPVNASLSLYQLFPVETVEDNKYDFADIIRVNRTARYRSFDGRIHVSERNTGSQAQVKLAPLSTSYNQGEYETLQLAFARTGGTNEQALARAVYNDAENGTREIHARLEQAWGDVLTDGKLTISEEGFSGEADYGVPANQLVSATTPYTTLSADLITEIEGWLDVYVAANGFRPAYMLPSLRIRRLFGQNQKMIAAIKGTAAGVSRVSLAEMNEWLGGEGFPTFLDPYDTMLDIDGTATRVIADDKLIFLPPNIADLGATVMGVSATALELVNSTQSDLSFSEAPGIVGVVEKVGPPYRQFTFLDAVGQPVLKDGRKLMVADVI